MYVAGHMREGRDLATDFRIGSQLRKLGSDYLWPFGARITTPLYILVADLIAVNSTAARHLGICSSAFSDRVPLPSG
jgi:hypothetical protein